jgi:electron transfer flavoprotein-quinone oxidoreductase
MKPEKFDTIVVGAGLAGITAALVLARAGLKVALFERGGEPGGKNVSGGVLYHSEVLNKLLPEFWKEAPIERYITRRIITMLSPGASLSFDYTDTAFSQAPYNGFSLLRSKFDPWYARKAEEAGALIIPETEVEDLVRDRGRVIGVKARRDEGTLYSDAVIIADGANSLLAEKAGLKKKPSPGDYSIAVKELLALPPETIEERFNLGGNEGVASEFIGSCTRCIKGGAFLYTNKASLSVGVVAKLDDLEKNRVSIAELMETFKNHPYIKGLLDGAVLREYSGHLIPEGGINAVPRLYGPGFLVAGDAAGLVLSNGISLEGMNFAIASGYTAAETVKKARQTGDFSGKSLALYRSMLKQSFVLKDLKTFRRAHDLLQNPRLYGLYPELACGIARGLFEVSDRPRRKLWHIFRKEMKGKTSWWQLARDGMKIARALLC